MIKNQQVLSFRTTNLKKKMIIFFSNMINHTDGKEKRSVVAGSIDGSILYCDLGKKYVTLTPP
jgi:hypothetical protein